MFVRTKENVSLNRERKRERGREGERERGRERGREGEREREIERERERNEGRETVCKKFVMAGDFSGKPLEFGCRFESVDVRETELWN